MSDQDAFERIVAAVQEAMLDDVLWPAASALIDEAVGTVGNALVVSGGPAAEAPPHFVGIYKRGERHAEWEREWLAVYQPGNECVPRFLQLPDRHLVRLADLYTAEELQTSRAYNEGLRRIGGQQGVIARLDGPAGSTIAWATGDPVIRGGWAAAQHMLMKGLLPHIRQFVRVRQALATTSARGAALHELLDSRGLGVLYLDRGGQIIEANERAAALLRQGNGEVSGWEGLSVGVPAERARLVRLVAAALAPTSGPAVSGSMRLHRRTSPTVLVVHVTPVARPAADLGGRAVAALMLLVAPDWPAGLEPAVVAEVLGLTSSESEVAVGLTAGRTVTEIAQATGRTVGAVHWHLRQIYRKHHIHRQAELVRLVLDVTAFARR